jgi:acyl-CoA oxidase
MASFEDESSPWARAFAADVAGLRSEGVTYADSAAFLRALVRKGSLRFTDVRDHPRRFFLAHRLLARLAPEHGPGFWIRFTVQYNLFAGTIVALGGDAQLAELEEMQSGGVLGCFCLTERLAGVNSGLVVHTVAEWDPDLSSFIIDSPTDGAYKNWISQGLTAEKAVCVADLRVGGRSHGPHAFLVDLRDATTGALLPGVEVGDMGRKTTGVDLDNAWVRFDRLRVGADRLLNRYGEVVNGEYVVKQKGTRTMDMIGQRLYTGRVAVAQAALTFSRRLFADARAYSDAKMCVMRGDRPALTDVPQLRALYDEAEARLTRLDAFVAAREGELCECLVERRIPPEALTRAVAVCKIRAVETSVELCHRLKQEVGSYALMDGTGFQHCDFLQCCKFAEGDSRILSQKLARDAFAAFAKNKGNPPGEWSRAELDACARVLAATRNASGRGASKTEAWDEAWRDVYDLADAVCDRVCGGAEPRGGAGRAKL